MSKFASAKRQQNTALYVLTPAQNPELVMISWRTIRDLQTGEKVVILPIQDTANAVQHEMTHTPEGCLKIAPFTASPNQQVSLALPSPLPVFIFFYSGLFKASCKDASPF